MNLRSKKWLLCFNYNSNKSLLEHHLNEIQAQLEIFCEKNEGLLISVDFNANVSESTPPAGIYLFKVKNGNTRTMCDICSKLIIKTPERSQ